MAWNLLITADSFEREFLEEAGHAEMFGDYEDVVIARGERGGGRSPLGDYLVGTLTAREQTKDGILGERIGILACDYQGSIEFLEGGIAIEGNPIVSVPDPEDSLGRGLFHKFEHVEVRWEMTMTPDAKHVDPAVDAHVGKHFASTP